jgi:hypothetical protein
MCQIASPVPESTGELPEVLAEREACAQLLELTNAELRLAASEISAEEMRTIQAILAWLGRRMRDRARVRQAI